METDVTNRVYLILRWFEHPKDPNSYGLGGGSVRAHCNKQRTVLFLAYLTTALLLLARSTEQLTRMCLPGGPGALIRHPSTAAPRCF